MNFATFVLGLPARDLGKPLVSAFTKGIRDKAATRRPERKQARPLKVSEVMHLEEMLGNDKVDLQDRYAAGAFLFAIYARCRWSDLKRVQDFDLDVALSIGKLVGFLGFSTFSHKTASQVAKHGLPMPLVAPIWGLCSPPWAMTWKRVAEAVKLGFAEHSKGPLLPAPGKEGGWTGRSVTSDEASKWLGELLKLCSSELEKVSSHSLKATTLSWMAKAGSDEHHRTILGHHSTGKKSLEIYSRDFLSAPLRTLEDVLRQVRVGSLRPDLTRSGHIQEATGHDCKESENGHRGHSTADEANGASSSSFASSSSSSSAEGHWTSLGSADPCALQSRHKQDSSCGSRQ